MKNAESRLQILMLVQHLANNGDDTDFQALKGMSDRASESQKSVFEQAKADGVINSSTAESLEASFQVKVANSGGDLRQVANEIVASQGEDFAPEMKSFLDPRNASLDPHATAMEDVEDDDADATLWQDSANNRSTQPEAKFDTEDGQQRLVPLAEQDAASRYAPLRFHARGGIGEIHIAQDYELNREVALKEIRPQYSDDEPSRARFVLEGEVTGRLEHPGVVPVYGMGVDEAGKPFYAMRFIRGESLTKALKRYHSDASEKDNQRIEYQKLLRQFISICQTIDYAHSRGVLHRDLKPDNIMLGPFGETLVVDWGLAKIIGRDEEVRSKGGAEATLHPSHSDPGETVRGSVAGTLLYMSPEQAMGWHDRLRATADVFSLGAILFEVLTGRTLYVAKTVEAAQRIAIECQTDSPRELNSSIGKSLEAICAKALAKEPQHRYQSAGALAKDIEAFLADEPTTAREDSFIERSGRWARKHRTFVSSATAAGIIAIASLSGLTWILSAKNKEIASKNTEITRQRDQSNENLALARESVRDFLNTLSTDERIQEAGLDRLRLELTEQAQPYYERFLAENPDSEELRYEQAKLLSNLARINYQAASRDDAKKQMLANRQILMQLSESNLGNERYVSDLAQAANRMGILELDSGNWQQAISYFEEVEHYAEQLPAVAFSESEEEPNSVASEESLKKVAFKELNQKDLRIFSMVGIGEANLQRGDLQAAKEYLQKSLELAYGVAGEATDGGKATSTPHRRALSAIVSLAKVDALLGNYAAAEARYLKALDAVPPDAENEVEIQVFKAGILSELGALEIERGQPLAALKRFQQAHAISKEAYAEFPENLEVRDSLAVTNSNLTIPFNEIAPRDQDQAALLESQRKRLQESLVETQSQLEKNPKLYNTRINETFNRRSLAMLLHGRGDYAEARQALQGVRGSLEQIVAEHPMGWMAHYHFAWTLMNLADVLSVEPDDREESKQLVVRAIAIFEREYQRNGAVQFLHAANLGYWRLAQLAADTETIIAMNEKRLALISSLPEETRQAPSYLIQQSGCYEMMAYANSNAGDSDAGSSNLQKAIELTAQVIEQVPLEPAYKMRRYLLDITKTYREMELADGLTNDLQDKINQSVGSVSELDPEWTRTDVIETVIPALELLADNCLANEDYVQQVTNLELAVRMVDELYARKENKKELLKKAKLEIALASALFGAGEEDRYLPTLETARDTAEKYLSIQPRSQTAKNILAQSYLDAGQFYLVQGDDQAAYRQYDLAVELGSALITTQARVFRALSNVRLGNYLTAVADIQRIDSQADLGVDRLYEAAMVFALSCAELQDDESAGDKVRSVLLEAYRKEAIRFLRRSFQAAGEDLASYVEYAGTDENLESIWSLPEFAALRDEFGSRAEPPQADNLP